MFNFNSIFKKINSLGSRSCNGSCRPSGVYEVISQNELINFLSDDVCILDVRTEREFFGMHLKNSINIPFNMILKDAPAIIPDKNTKILIYCATGDRTNFSIQKLNSLGYNNLYIWNGGGLNTLKIRELLE